MVVTSSLVESTASYAMSADTPEFSPFIARSHSLFVELCGSSMSLKCKLPSEDLDVLVSVTTDEDLANVIDEYDRFSSSTGHDLKIRATLFPLKSVKKISPPPSAVSSVDFSPSKLPSYAVGRFCSPPHTVAKTTYRYGSRNYSLAVGFPVGVQKDGRRMRSYPFCEQGNPMHLYHSR
ncbi:hypothetical protein F0562_024313 [Nyssa sinensis]|uniref:PB1 domain-containing protein n=1 Tax=Nyssa sinensis TaxID=561372 RepID=A0A5J5BDQ9_9ASTE|nr:hypothetical protein F0562_024313 [Nyssa sinensis]